MCLKKSERNILIFVVHVHYAITVCNAFQAASERKDLVAIRFNFDALKELKMVLTELELDRECAVKCTNKKEDDSSESRIGVDGCRPECLDGETEPT
jgi:hypothetical protein